MLERSNASRRRCHYLAFAIVAGSQAVSYCVNVTGHMNSKYQSLSQLLLELQERNWVMSIRFDGRYRI